MSESFRFVEVSHVIGPGMKTYPGLPVPEAGVPVGEHLTNLAAVPADGRPR